MWRELAAKRTFISSSVLQELRLNKIEAEKFLAPEDTTLDKVRTTLQVAALAGLMAASFGLHWKVDQVIAILGGTAFLLVADQVANMGGVEALVVDTAARFVDKDYANRVALHEAGHFLTAYLVGLLPRDYCLSSLDAFRRYRVLNVQAGCKFCDGAFQREVASGKLKASSLERFACVALAGVATEYMYFGRAEGGIADVQQLDGLMRALGFSQKKADGEVRWAVLNTVELLRRHRAVHGRLADAMYRGEPVAECVRIIEDGLKDCEDV
ncbi:unnamed protein product [Pedinophyceae sp. YPF-701]|nr:unnamed protein product [Pedinophyceae sp. YPF-701]